MKKFSFIAILLILEAISFTQIHTIDAISKFALWGSVFTIIFFRKLFNLEAGSDLQYTSENIHLFETQNRSIDDKTVLASENVLYKVNNKWLYLSIALINFSIMTTLILIRK